MQSGAVKIILYDQHRRFLLQHRTDDADLLPGHWSFFGGAIEKGEGPDEAVRREAMEETSYPLRRPRLVFESELYLPAHSGLQYFFIEAYDNVTQIILGEGQGFGWYSFDQAKMLKMIDRDRDMLEFIDRHLRRSEGEVDDN